VKKIEESKIKKSYELQLNQKSQEIEEKSKVNASLLSELQKLSSFQSANSNQQDQHNQLVKTLNSQILALEQQKSKDEHKSRELEDQLRNKNTELDTLMSTNSKKAR